MIWWKWGWFLHPKKYNHIISSKNRFIPSGTRTFRTRICEQSFSLLFYDVYWCQNIIKLYNLNSNPLHNQNKDKLSYCRISLDSIICTCPKIYVNSIMIRWISLWLFSGFWQHTWQRHQIWTDLIPCQWKYILLIIRLQWWSKNTSTLCTSLQSVQRPPTANTRDMYLILSDALLKAYWILDTWSIADLQIFLYF